MTFTYRIRPSSAISDFEPAIDYGKYIKNDFDNNTNAEINPNVMR